MYGENRFRIECYRPLKIESLEELMINTPHKCFNVNIVKSIWTMRLEPHGWYSCIVWIIAPTESKEKGNRHENTFFMRFFFIQIHFFKCSAQYTIHYGVESNYIYIYDNSPNELIFIGMTSKWRVQKTIVISCFPFSIHWNRVSIWLHTLCMCALTTSKKKI